MWRPCRAQIIFGGLTAGSSALRASSPTAILCHAPRGAFLRLRRWIVGGHALAAIAGICNPLGEHSVKQISDKLPYNILTRILFALCISYLLIDYHLAGIEVILSHTIIIYKGNKMLTK